MHVSSVAEEPQVTYRGPDPKQLMSARIRRSTRMGIEALVKLWQMRAEKVGDEADEIDLTYVVDAVLAAGVHSELKQFLGEGEDSLPTSESAWEAVLARIEKSNR